MPSNFDSFDQSPLGSLIESPLGVRGEGGNEGSSVNAENGVYVTIRRKPNNTSATYHNVERQDQFNGSLSSQQFTFSFWFRVQEASATSVNFGSLFRHEIVYSQSDQVASIYIYHNHSNAAILSGQITNLASGSFVHVLVSIDTNAANGNLSYLYINGKLASQSLLNMPAVLLQTPFYLDNTGATGFSDIYVHDNQYVDLSDPANLANFISDSEPVDLTSFSPILYLSGDYNEWFNNKGVGGEIFSKGSFHNISDDLLVIKSALVARDDSLTIRSFNNPRDCSADTIYTIGDVVKQIIINTPVGAIYYDVEEFEIRSQLSNESLYIPYDQCVNTFYYLDRGGFYARQSVDPGNTYLIIYTDGSMPADFADGEYVDLFEVSL